MDRSMYGKIAPGTLNPYQCTLKKGSPSPGCEDNTETKIPRKAKIEKIPIAVVEYHHEVIPFIYGRIGAKKIPLYGNSLIHFDSHPDLLIPKDMPSSFVFDKNKLIGQLNIADWILPACFAGHFTTIVWIKPPWAHQIGDGVYNFNVGENNEGKIRLDCKENYFVSEGLFVPSDQLKNEKNVILEVLTLGELTDDFVDQDSTNRMKKITSNISKNFVLDVDLDFFSTRNPFEDIYKKADLYNKLKDLYKFTRPKSNTDQDVFEASENRNRQIKELEELFKYLNKNKQLPVNDQSDLYKGVEKIRSSMLEVYKDEEIDWELVHDSGCTSDEDGLPHHVSTKEERETLYQCFSRFLDDLLVPPDIFTISRSTDDDYTPKENVEEIQYRVLDCLDQSFCCDEPIKDYLNYCSSGSDNEKTADK